MSVLSLHSLCTFVSRSDASLVALPIETDLGNCGGTGQELQGRTWQKNGQNTPHRNVIVFNHLEKGHLYIPTGSVHKLVKASNVLISYESHK